MEHNRWNKKEIEKITSQLVKGANMKFYSRARKKWEKMELLERL